MRTDIDGSPPRGGLPHLSGLWRERRKPGVSIGSDAKTTFTNGMVYIPPVPPVFQHKRYVNGPMLTPAKLGLSLGPALSLKPLHPFLKARAQLGSIQQKHKLTVAFPALVVLFLQPVIVTLYSAGVLCLLHSFVLRLQWQCRKSKPNTPRPGLTQTILEQL